MPPCATYTHSCRDEWVGGRVLWRRMASLWWLGDGVSEASAAAGALAVVIGRKGLDSTSPGLHAGRQDQARVNDMGRARAGL